MGWFGDFIDGAKKSISDTAAIGKQVFDGVLSAGSSAIEGAKTMVTDPKKFISDVGSNLEAWGGHIRNSVQDGMDDFGEGWDRAVATGNPGMFLWNALGGTAKIMSFGASDAISEHIEASSDIVTDELGNMVGYDIHEGTDAITRVFLEKTERSKTVAYNANKEIDEAIEEGDTERANDVFGQMVKVNVLDPVADTAGKIALVAGVTAVGIGTGGAGFAVAAGISGAAGATSIVSKMGADKTAADFNRGNVDDDVSDRVQSEIDALTASGQLSEAQADTYRQVAQAYYQNASYMNYGNSLGEAYMGEGAGNGDFRKWLFESNGLPVYEPPEDDGAAGLVANVASGIGRAVHERSEGILAPRPGEASLDRDGGGRGKDDPGYSYA